MSNATVYLASREEWQEAVDGDKSATFFHTPLWYDIWQEYTRCNTCVYAFKSSSITVLPVLEVKPLKGSFTKRYSSMVGTYGGLVSTGNIGPDEWKKFENAGLFKNIELRANPFSSAVVFSGARIKKDHTQVIELKGSYADQLKTWTHGHLSAAKKGIREGVKVRIAENESDWLAYYDCYLKSVARWGDKASEPYGKSLFMAMFRRANAKSGITLWLAEKDDLVIAGCLCFQHGKHMSYWHGAALDEFFNFRPVHVLQYEIIRYAFEAELTWYDMNPSGGHTGVIAFKKGFGAYMLPADLYIKESGAYALYKKAKNMVKAK